MIQDDFKQVLTVEDKNYHYFCLQTAAEKYQLDVSRMPVTLKILLENLLRNYDNKTVQEEDIIALMSWTKTARSDHEIAFRPARVLMQDFTGVPAVVDLAAMRDAIATLGGDPQKINPLSPVDLVIDHSVQVDYFGNSKAFALNVAKEIERNLERYQFLRWGQEAFTNFRVVPPGTGICHQVNLEYLAKVVWNNQSVLYPDTVFGTDSHTTMVNGLAVLGWGVGGIEAEAAMLGQPTIMVIPDVVGFKLIGKLNEGVTATDLVLTITNILRKKGVVGKFVEFFGNGLHNLTLADRATIANMAPEYGATCGYFPIDNETLNYLRLSGRSHEEVVLVEQYAKAQNMWHGNDFVDPIYTETIELDLAEIHPCIAGPKRPQDLVLLKDAKQSFTSSFPEATNFAKHQVENKDYQIGNGDIAIAAITSCTNTSNPYVMIAAALLAKRATELGLTCKPWVKTSLAPGSGVVTKYLEDTDLQQYLDKMGFYLVGYGCTTCIGNSGPLDKDIENTVTSNNLNMVAVLSGNRNFEGRIHPLAKASYLASPALVVAYAIAGTINIDLANDPIGKNNKGEDIYLKDIWPSNAEISEYVNKFVTPALFREKYKDVFTGDEAWKNIKFTNSVTYDWQGNSTYVKLPPYFANLSETPGVISDIKNAKLLALLGDSITTDHISPAGNIAKNSPAAKYLLDCGVSSADFNSYGARRGNHEVMMRGTFANTRIKNELTPGIEGGVTKYKDEVMSIYDAAMKYKADGNAQIIIAGKEYGTGSSRDWAAKGPYLQGVKAVIAESFERIHRSNLIGMGIIPCVFINENRSSLKLQGDENFEITGLVDMTEPKAKLVLTVFYSNGSRKDVNVICRVDTLQEIEYLKHGGVLPYMVRELL